MGCGNSVGDVYAIGGASVGDADTLGGAWCGVCILRDVGSGARVGRVLRSGTLGGIGGVGGSCVRQTDGSEVAGASSSGMVALKRADNYRKTRIWSSPRARKGNTCAGLRNASVSILAASAALSIDDAVGISISWGKNSTVRAIYSDLVFVTYTIWYW